MFCLPSLLIIADYTFLSPLSSLSPSPLFLYLILTAIISVYSLTDQTDLPLLSSTSSLSLSPLSSSSAILLSPLSLSSSVSTLSTHLPSPITEKISVPTLLTIFDDLIVDPGKSVSLKCETSGLPMPTITWKLDGSLINNSDTFLVADFVSPLSTLQLPSSSSSLPQPPPLGLKRLTSFVNITSISVKTGGLYSCIATNRVASASHSARLNVKGDPYVKPLKDIRVTSGSTVIINCPYSGYPIETIYWTKGSIRLPSNRRQEIFSNGSLVINSIQKTVDDGSYTCHASNGIKTSAQQLKLLVTGT